MLFSILLMLFNIIDHYLKIISANLYALACNQLLYIIRWVGHIIHVGSSVSCYFECKLQVNDYYTHVKYSLILYKRNFLNEITPEENILSTLFLKMCFSFFTD